MQIGRFYKASGVAAATLSLAMLAGCSSDSGSEETTTTSPAVTTPTTPAVSPSDAAASMIGPIMVMPGTTAVDATVGRFLNFKVDGDPGDWRIESDRPDVVAVTPGGEKDGATFNPGGEAVSAGIAVITLTDQEGSVWKVTVTVA